MELLDFIKAAENDELSQDEINTKLIGLSTSYARLKGVRMAWLDAIGEVNQTMLANVRRICGVEEESCRSE